MNNQEFKFKVLGILKANLSSDEFSRVKSITVEDSQSFKEAKAILKAKELEAKIAEDNYRSKADSMTKAYIKELVSGMVKDLANYCGVDKVVVVPTTVSIAQYLQEQGKITPRQKETVIKYYVDDSV